MTSIKAMTAMFIEPNKSFEMVRNRSMISLPLISVILGAVVIFIWYFQSVDFSWLQDYMTASVSDPTQRDMAKKVMTKNMLSTVSIVSTIVGTPVIYCAIALYFLIVSKIKNFPISFGKWFSFVAWASVPSLLLLPLGAMQILFAKNGQLGMEQLNPTSLNQLIFHFSMGQPWQSLLDTINAFTVWTAILMVIGFQEWTKQSRIKSVATVFIPYVVIYGGWVTLISLGKIA